MAHYSNSSEEILSDAILSDYARYIIGSSFIIITITGTVGNSLTLLSVFLSTKLQTKTNVFVVSLACYDLMTCSLIGPLQAVALFSRKEPMVPDNFLILLETTVFFTITASIFTLTMIAIIRFVKIKKSAVTYNRCFTTLNITLMMMTSLACSGAGCLYLSFSPDPWRLKYDWSFKIYRIVPGSNGMKIFLFASDLVFCVVCVLVVSICYINIALFIKAHNTRVAAAIEQGPTNHGQRANPSGQEQNQANEDGPSRNYGIQNQELATVRTNEERQLARKNRIIARELKITKNLVTITMIFLVCYLPMPFLMYVSNGISDICIYYLMLGCSAVNPFIYAFTHSDFPKVYRCVITGSLNKIPFPCRPLRTLLQYI